VTRRLVVEADGGSRGNPGPAAYGAVVRDAETGAVLAERAQYLGVTTNNVAEYSGLIAGLTAAREIDPDALVEIRLDSKLVVEQMTGRWRIKHEDMRRLALEARAILPASQLTYQWVPRSENAAADRLANAAMDAAAQGRTWEADPPAYPGGVSETTAQTGQTNATPAPRLSYRLLTGVDTTEFCERVSEALADGYQLHGSPAIAYDGTKTIVAQALVDPRMLGFGT
jgi:ribonuclease H / adenosylcobalamin/alpha-ribazole phosphatase